MSKRLRSQSSERIAVVSGPIGSHCRLKRGADSPAAADAWALVVLVTDSHHDGRRRL
jgi:hypothetical protein